ncbi:hypothetical protein [Nocardioides baekrokdamisoli]|nr:hypothetical protein [Nocardioides baekrokdamisoli]
MPSPARRLLPRAATTALLLVAMTCALVLGSSTGSNAALSVRPDVTTVHVRAGGHVAIGVRVNYTGAQRPSLRVVDPPRGITSRIYATAEPYGSFDAVDFIAALATPLGTYHVTVAAYAGRTVVRFPVTVVVSEPGTFTLRLAPPLRTALVGGAVNYSIRLEGLRPAPGPNVSLIVHGFPLHSRVTLTAPTVNSRTFVTVHATFPAGVKPGTYRIMAQGRAGTELESSFAYLVLRAKPPTRPGQVGPPFTISGQPVDALSPGSTSPINLAITNTANSTLSVDSLTVSMTGTNQAGCATSNFTLAQYHGLIPLQIPANSTLTLQQLGIPTSAWPTISMLDLPVNQDACKSTTVLLAYAGTGSGL